MKLSYVFSLALMLSMVMQNERVAEVQGGVMDMRGKPIAGAVVVYTNVGNKRTYSVKTDDTGRFLIIGMMIGTYDLRITGPAGQQIYSVRKGVFAGDNQS